MSQAPPSAQRRPPSDLPAGEAHLWLLRLRESIPPPVERAWRDLLSADELEANRRIRVDSARRQHLAARALVRATLSRYAPIAPRQWKFRAGPAGKPELAGPAGAPPLAFNLSHTRGLVACVVTRGRAVGVDVERSDRRLSDPLALARHGFASAEREALARLAGDARRELFCRLWTLKEAYVKARGAGFLALPARALACAIDDAGLVHLTFGPELEDRAADWQLALLAPGREHRLAVAIHRGRSADLELIAHQVEPAPSAPRRLRPELLARSPAPTAALAATE